MPFTAAAIHCSGYQLRRSPIATVRPSNVTVIHCGGHPLQRSSTATVGYLLRRSSRFRIDPPCSYYPLPCANLCSSYKHLFTPPTIREYIHTLRNIHEETNIRRDINTGTYTRRKHTREGTIVGVLDVCVELIYYYEGRAEVLCI